jgi:hypothetical protein
MSLQCKYSLKAHQRKRHTHLIACKSFQLITRSSGEASLPNASAIRLTSLTTSVVKSNAFRFVSGIFYQITGTLYQHSLLNASKLRITYHTNDENIQETLDEMSGRKRVVGNEL